MTPLDEARREAVARLCVAQVDGLISVEDFESRYALIRDAETEATIRAIIADLTPRTPIGSAALAVGDDAYDLDSYETPGPIEEVPSIRLPSILGSTTRGGFWTVPEHLEVLVILGEMHLDFRDATFAGETVEIDMSVTLGTLKVTVPPGTQVENEVREVLASSKFPKRGRTAAPPNGYLVLLRGSLFLSELVIKEAQPSGVKKGLRQRLGLAPP